MTREQKGQVALRNRISARFPSDFLVDRDLSEMTDMRRDSGRGMNLLWTILAEDEEPSSMINLSALKPTLRHVAQSFCSNG